MRSLQGRFEDSLREGTRSRQSGGAEFDPYSPPRGRVVHFLSGLLFLVLLCTVSVLAQNSNSQNKSSSSQPPADSKKSDTATAPEPAPNPKLEPPRSDRVNINDMGNTEGESSSKNTQIDLSPPADDAKEHPRRADAMDNAENPPDSVNEMHAWDPHKAAKDIEVGDFYFKRKNYRAAESRYREALYYKNNDAEATFRLAICMEKLQRPDDAVAEFQSYLRILPNGSKSEDARRAIERLSKPQSEKAAK